MAGPRTALAPTLLTLEECAALSRSPLSSVRHWIATGKLAARRPGRRVLVKRADLATFLGLTLDELGTVSSGPHLPSAA